MEVFTINHLNFAYPEQEKNAISDLTLSVRPGEFLVLCGPSGCGKSTLLRQLKTVLAPHGRRSGEILFDGRNLDSLDQREQAETIGFVQQSPENQIVTDKVWHELAFGLESLGCDTPSIRRRVAEMASFFGIQDWFHKKVDELSGGQKQLLALASVMVLQPRLLILDEPTSQLDPIAAADFLQTVGRLNRELGITVLLTEHRLEEALPLATHAAVLDGGHLLCAGAPEAVCRSLRGRGHDMFLAMPAAVRIWAGVDSGAPCPITVREGRDFLSGWCDEHPLCPLPPEPVYPAGDTALAGAGLWFRYEPDQPDVVRGLDLQARRGELLALLGGNGAGKSTTLGLLSGALTPQRGTVTHTGRIGVLPQDPQALFVKNTVRQDLYESFDGTDLPKDQRDRRVEQVTALCRLTELLDRHPYDLSGGEQQRAALGKVLLHQPDILLLDEPLGALDLKLRKEMQLELKRLQREMNITFIYVTHDQSEAMALSDSIIIMNKGVVAQIGSPQEIYYHPNSEFVADFIGEANFLKGKCVALEDGCGVLQLADTQVRVAATENMTVGEDYTIVLRPESAGLVPEGDLKCRVVLSCFMGAYQNYHVMVGDTLVKLTDYNPKNHRIYQVGETCALTFEPDGVHVL